MNLVKKFFKKLFCVHKYERKCWYATMDDHTNERYSVRLYKCKKCGKEIWVDGRYDIYP